MSGSFTDPSAGGVAEQQPVGAGMTEPPPPPVHPAAAIFPMLPDDELQALADDIKEHGLRQPIVLAHPDREILDGRNRLAACRIAGVRAKYEVFKGDAWQYVIPECRCGIYAVHASELWTSWDDPDSVVGFVAASGLVIDGPQGFRAERVGIVALFAFHSHDQLADRYGVPVLHDPFEFMRRTEAQIAKQKGERRWDV